MIGPTPAPTEDGVARVCSSKFTAPRSVGLVLSALVVALNVVYFWRILPMLNKPEPKGNIQAPRRFILNLVGSGFALGLLGVASSAFVIFVDGDFDRSSAVRSFLLWLFVVVAVVSRAWTITIFRHILWVMGLPRRRGSLEVIIATSRAELVSRKANASRAVTGLFCCLLLANAYPMWMWLATQSITEDSRRYFRILLLASVFLYLLLDIVLVISMATVAVTARRLMVLPQHAARLAQSSVASFVTLLNFAVVVAFSVYTSGNSLKEALFEGDSPNCVAFWVSNVLLIPIMCSALVNHFAFAQLCRPAAVIRATAAGCRSVAEALDGAADALDEAPGCCGIGCCGVATCCGAGTPPASREHARGHARGGGGGRHWRQLHGGGGGHGSSNRSQASVASTLQTLDSRQQTSTARDQDPLLRIHGSASSVYDLTLVAQQEGQGPRQGHHNGGSARLSQPSSPQGQGGLRDVSGCTPSDEALARMAEVLRGGDTDLLLIPKEFVEVEARPLAAGGFAQVMRTHRQRHTSTWKERGGAASKSSRTTASGPVRVWSRCTGACWRVSGWR
jgi:hypothetical protein